MLKNKEKRDTYLLIFMGVIFILFLVYLFVPFDDNDDLKGKNKTTQKIETQNTQDSRISKSGVIEDDYLGDLNQKITAELIKIFKKSKESKNAFFDYDTQALKQIITKQSDSGDEQEEQDLFFKHLKKISHLSFYDLAEIVNYEYPENVKKSLIFNIYLSSFLIKAREENIKSEVEDLSDAVFEKVVNLEAYHLLSQEIEQDYQTYPILFFFMLILERTNLYPTEDDLLFFREKISPIRDLSEDKLVLNIKDLISFSVKPEKYRIEWTEKDGLVDPDDNKKYSNIGLRTFNFLKQIYLVFPDYYNEKSNLWIKELLLADSGSIELVGFQISSEDTSKHFQIQKIFYTPQKSQFIVLLKGNNFPVTNNILERVVFQRMTDFQQNFLCVDFELRFINQKSFKKELLNFGIYLKKQVSVK